METYREDYWKLAEVEDRFNKLQGGLRALASTWTLAAFAGLAVLLQVPEKTTWLAPPAFLAWFVCILAVVGLALLWIMDQFVYQRLLAAPFLSALLLEEAHSDLPPIRALMLSGSSGGMSRYLKLFYFIPIALFCLLSVAAVAAPDRATYLNAEPMSGVLRVALALGSVVTVVTIMLMYRLSGKVGARALAKGLGLDSITSAVDPGRLVHAVAAAIRTIETKGLADATADGEAAQPRSTSDAPQAAHR